MTHTADEGYHTRVAGLFGTDLIGAPITATRERVPVIGLLGCLAHTYGELSGTLITYEQLDVDATWLDGSHEGPYNVITDGVMLSWPIENDATDLILCDQVATSQSKRRGWVQSYAGNLYASRAPEYAYKIDHQEMLKLPCCQIPPLIYSSQMGCLIRPTGFVAQGCGRVAIIVRPVQDTQMIDVTHLEEIARVIRHGQPVRYE